MCFCINLARFGSSHYRKTSGVILTVAGNRDCPPVLKGCFPSWIAAFLLHTSFWILFRTFALR